MLVAAEPALLAAPLREPAGLLRERAGLLREPAGLLREPAGLLREPARLMRCRPVPVALPWSSPPTSTVRSGQMSRQITITQQRPMPHGIGSPCREGWRR